MITDDDETGPYITITYNGDATDGAPGAWDVIAVDPESGIDSVIVEIDGLFVGTATGVYTVPNSLGPHTITVTATNGDLDRGVIDQETSSATTSVNIIDDDITGPIIDIAYVGNNLDASPGVWIVSASDSESGIDTLLVEIDGVPVGTTTGTYGVPNSLGPHILSVTAVNADLDRGAIDQESSIESNTVTILDDDTLPPEVSNLTAIADGYDLVASFSATDQSGIADIQVKLDDLQLVPDSIVRVGDKYTITFENLVLPVGEHSLAIEIADGDNDRPDDSLSTIISTTVRTPPVMAMRYVLEALEQVLNELPTNLSTCLNQCLSTQLNIAICEIQWAILSFEDSKIFRAVLLDKLAKIHLTIANILVEINDKLDRISDTVAANFIKATHSIRDQLTLIMGEIIDLPLAQTIATIEVSILNLADDLYSSLSFVKALTIDINLWLAAESLDTALVQLSKDTANPVDCYIQKAVRKLEHAQTMVNLWNRLGCISDEVATSINDQIDINIDQLNSI
jgi:hypothetical protein